MPIRESQKVQWWLARLDQYDNPKLVDGAHDEAAGAHEAMYLFKQLGLAKNGERYAVAKVELFEAVPDGSNINHEAIKTLNNIGLKPNA